PAPPPQLPFTAAERPIITRLRSPLAVQRWLNALPYNNEKEGETLRSFRGVVQRDTAHCLEAALSAAVILEQHRYPPLVLSFESIDLLDHVIFVYRGPHGWGSVARSRDPGLHGRRPVFACPSASSNRRDSASPRVFSAATDCSKSASRRRSSSARMRVASFSSGLSPRSGALCETTRPRLVSITSSALQHGHGTSISLFSFAMTVFYEGIDEFTNLRIVGFGL